MKKRNVSLFTQEKRDGYGMLNGGAFSVGLMRAYWKGSPWRALQGITRRG